MSAKEEGDRGDFMTFPVNEQVFIDRWLSALNEPDEGDREQATATVQAINRAYYAGLEAGRESCDVTTEGGVGVCRE